MTAALPAVTGTGTTGLPHATVDALRDTVEAERRGLHEQLTAVFEDPLFAAAAWPHTRAAAWRLAYDRLALLSRTFGVDRGTLAAPQRYFALQEWTAVVDGVVAGLVAAHLNLGLGTLTPYAEDSAHTARAAADMESLATYCAFLGTEAAWGVDLARLETELRHDPVRGELVLHTPHPGARKFMPNATPQHVAKTAIVLARLTAHGQDRGIVPVLCPISDAEGRTLPGVTVTPMPDKAGLWSDNALTAFDHVRLPADALLHSPAAAPGHPLAPAAPRTDRRLSYARSVHRIRTGKIGLAASSVAQARAATAIALKFARHRGSTGGGSARVPLLAHRVHHAALLDAVADTYAVGHLANAAMRREAELARGAPAPAAATPADHLLASLTKYVTSRTVDRVVRRCALLCGAHGMFDANRFPHYSACTQGVMIAEGENTVVAVAAAQDMLAGRGYTPPAPEPPPDLPVDDPRLWPLLARERERLAHAATRARLTRARAGHGTFLDSWNTCENEALALVERHGLRLALEEFLRAADRTRDAKAARLLRDLAGVFALRDLRQDAAFLAAHGLLDAERFRELPAALDTLYGRLAPELPTLVAGFGIPDALLDVPAATAGFMDRYEALARLRDTGADADPRGALPRQTPVRDPRQTPVRDKESTP
ncbi:acyl-CoA dehydrogenase [Streptomyces indicus]|uniref:Acyl-CoA oxidase n=1 Tax=Streptomyces indicus TaxID=417292 RepID=A0A1G9AVL6_9ACTN|nr:acyl-CoA dehydrogenase [Streptomyces indicus]SDK31253.1 acyl-CoA oxidase [Streptomyces indicus]